MKLSGAFRSVLVATAMFLGLFGAATVFVSIQAETEEAMSPPSGDAVELSFFMDVQKDTIAITHAGEGFPKRVPADISKLSPQPPVANTLALIVQLRDQSGAIVGLATEMEEFPLGEGGWSLEWDTYWTVVIPGHGSLMMYQKEGLDPELIRVLEETARTGKDWVGELTLITSRGPHESGDGIIIGGTGEYAGAKGTFQEIGIFRKISVNGEISAAIELRIRLQP